MQRDSCLIGQGYWILPLSRGGKFLKKLLCCIGGEYDKIIILVLSTGFICELATVKIYLKADVSSISPSSGQTEELWVVCGLYTKRWSYAIGWCMVM